MIRHIALCKEVAADAICDGLTTAVCCRVLIKQIYLINAACDEQIMQFAGTDEHLHTSGREKNYAASDHLTLEAYTQGGPQTAPMKQRIQHMTSLHGLDIY
jgi:hypothetical protein